MAHPENSDPFSRFGLKTSSPRIKKIPCFGKVRTFSTFRRTEKAYLIFSLTALIICIGLTIQRLVMEERDDSAYTFAILLFLSIAFCFYHILHSMFTENWAGILIFVANTAVVLIYCAVNAAKDPEGLHQSLIKLIRLSILGAVSPVLIAFGIYLSGKYWNSTKFSFDTMGQHGTLQKASRMLRTCVRLLIFDFQLQVSMLILVMGEGVVNMPPDQIIAIASGIPFTFSFLFVGYHGLKQESNYLMYTFYSIGLCEPTFIIYRFHDVVASFDKTEETYASTLACGCFALIVWMLLYASTAYFMLKYFNVGLKQRMLRENNESEVGPATPLNSPSDDSSEVTSSVAQELLECLDRSVPT